MYINIYVLSVDISVQARNSLHRRLSRPLKTMAIVEYAHHSIIHEDREEDECGGADPHDAGGVRAKADHHPDGAHYPTSR